MINANDPARWDDESIDAALTGLASIHSAVARPNVGADAAAVAGAARRKQVDRDGAAMARTGSACPRRDRPRSPRRGCAEYTMSSSTSVASWAGVLASMPRTLIHNDFNPRNIALRRDSGGLRLCAFDWELATIGRAAARSRRVPVVRPCRRTPRAKPIARWVERYRVAAGRRIGRRVSAHGVGDWIPRRALRAAGGPTVFLCDDRPRAAAGVPARVVRSWLNIFEWTAGRV